jgi:hypothetical protein
MAYIVKMTYTYPADKFPPDQTMRFPISSEVQALRDEFTKQGKILATDGYFSTDSFSGVSTVVFKSQNEFNEWCSTPMIAEFFVQRDEFLSSHGITKSSEFTTV